MAEPAFSARFRITDNRNRKSDKSPEQNIAVDFTPEQAIAAASWLMEAAEKAEREGTTVRQYTGQKEYQDVPGFTMWGGLWGQAGSFSPLKHETKEELPF